MRQTDISLHKIFHLKLAVVNEASYGQISGGSYHCRKEPGLEPGIPAEQMG